MIIRTQDGLLTHGNWWMRGKMRQANRVLSLEHAEGGIVLAQCKNAETTEELGRRFQNALLSFEFFDVPVELSDIANRSKE